ncbi:efflux RND transporter periplasmic adaptor subunit [Flectobacillus longus]|uniref:efflux RND transporter periplasmic adaptor subunit n=1 Tax=Flectobacillus longus TaxID=2984207 RepID=UPI0024B707AC|nr:efflux RND transporter periplasmic adaptor subunit [Flectobacillus longus]MDI9882631.1 efflux RND transporter periplasmic adaptor subunit [Flectobacillus longus]
MKKIPLLILAAGIIAGCKEKPKEKTHFEDSNVLAVKVLAVSSLDLSGNINATGLVSTEHEAKYSFKIGGVISRILVEEGQSFKKGQLLAVLNATEIAAGLGQSTLSVEKAQRDYDRAVNLYRDSVYTKEQLQNTKTMLDIAKKGRESVSFNEQYSKIYAAADGFVAKRMASEGEVVGAGYPVLVINEAKQNEGYLLRIGLTDREWASVSVGQKATVTLDGYPDRQIDAYVLRKSQTSDAASFQVELKLKLNNIRPAVGMFGKAQIAAGRAQHVISIPYDALVEVDGNTGYAFILKGARKVSKVPVEILSFDNKTVYLKDGLKATDQVVISNSAYLSEESIIKVIQ